MIRALVFDFDGLIIDTESALIRAYGDVHAMHNIAFDEATFLRSVGHADFAFDPWHAFEKRADRLALETERRRRNNLRNLELTLLPGVQAIIEGARDAGLRLGLASNSGHDHCERHLARLGLLHRFDFLACREDAPSPKPEPDLYRLVLQRFGLRGIEAIAFEDSHAGSLAAHRAGLHVVAVPNGSTAHHDFEHVHLRLKSLDETTLAALLDRFSLDRGR